MRFVQGLCALLVAIVAETGLGADFEHDPYADAFKVVTLSVN